SITCFTSTCCMRSDRPFPPGGSETRPYGALCRCAPSPTLPRSQKDANRGGGLIPFLPSVGFRFELLRAGRDQVVLIHGLPAGGTIRHLHRDREVERAQ